MNVKILGISMQSGLKSPWWSGKNHQGSPSITDRGVAARTQQLVPAIFQTMLGERNPMCQQPRPMTIGKGNTGASWHLPSVL